MHVRIKLQLFKLVYTAASSPRYSELLTEFSDVFKRLGCLPGKHTIVIDKPATPVIDPCRKVPFQLYAALKFELVRMRGDVITKVNG